MFVLLPISVDSGRVRPPLVCIAVAVGCIATFGLTAWVDGWLSDFALVPTRGVLQLGWFTSMFIHYGWLHLIGNLLFLYLVGPLLEDAWGSRRFAALFLGGGLVASATEFLLDWGQAIHIGGASGAIAACLGAFVVRFGAREVKVAYAVLLFGLVHGTFKMPAWILGALWFLTEVYALTGAPNGVATGAHVGGFAVGAAVAIAMKARGRDAVLTSTDEVDRVREERRQLLRDGRAAIDRSDLPAAESTLRQLLEVEPQHEEAALLLTELDVRAGRGAAAWSAGMRRLIARDDPSLESWVRRVWSSSWGHRAVSSPLALELALKFLAASDPSLDPLALELLRHAGEGEGAEAARAELELLELANDGRLSHELGRRALASLTARQNLAPEVGSRMRQLEPLLARSTSVERRGGPQVVPVKLQALDDGQLRLSTATQVRVVPLHRIAAVHAGWAAVGRREVLLVDLLIRRDEPGEPPLSLRLSSDDLAVAALFPGSKGPELWGAFVDRVVSAAGALRLPRGATTFPRFAGPEQVTASWREQNLVR